MSKFPVGVGGLLHVFFCSAHSQCYTGFLEGCVLVMASTLPIEIALEHLLTTVRVEVVVISALETFFPLVQSSPMLMTWNSHWWSFFFNWNDLISSLFILNYSWWRKIQNPRETRKVVLQLQITLIQRNKLFILTQSLPFSCHPLSLLFSEKSY